jgi:hypothetical protein
LRLIKCRRSWNPLSALVPEVEPRHMFSQIMSLKTMIRVQSQAAQAPVTKAPVSMLMRSNKFESPSLFEKFVPNPEQVFVAYCDKGCRAARRREQRKNLRNSSSSSVGERHLGGGIGTGKAVHSNVSTRHRHARSQNFPGSVQIPQLEIRGCYLEKRLMTCGNRARDRYGLPQRPG